MEFELNNIIYKIDKKTPDQQFHIIRRLAPCLADLMPDDNGKSSGVDAVKNIMEAISMMTDEEANHVLFGLLSCVKRKEENGVGYSNLVDSRTNKLMFGDITLAQMLKIAGESARANYADFFREIAQIFGGQIQQAKTL